MSASGRRRLTPGRVALLLALTPPLLAVGYLGSKHFRYEPAAPLHDYANRKVRAGLERSQFKSAEVCKGCHGEIYDQWRESYLSRSYDMAWKELDLHRLTLQLRGIDVGEVRFCLECHAPLALTYPEDLLVEDPLSREGVTCTVCHTAIDVVDDTTPSNITHDPTAGMAGPFDDAFSPFHQTRESELFKDGNSELCGACHNSAWPRTGLPIDFTYTEWQEHFEEGDETCVTCHMPEYEGKAAKMEGVEERTLRSHRFRGGHDPDTVRAAAEFEITATPSGDGLKLQVLVKNLTGHNLPTGNPPAPEARLYVTSADGDEVGFVSYRNAWKLANGGSTLDVTLAAEPGVDKTLLPYEERLESFEIARSDLSGPLRVWLEFSYWRPYEPSQRLGSYSETIMGHLTYPEENLVNVARTFAKKKTWTTLYNAIGSSKGDPILIQEATVQPDGTVTMVEKIRERPEGEL